METSPLGIRRLQTRPLPLAASQPPGDDTPTVAGPNPSAPGQDAPEQNAPGQNAPGQDAPVQDADATAALTAAGGTGTPAASPGRGPRPQKVPVIGIAAARTRQLSGAAVRRVVAYGRAGGAGDGGLAGLFRVNALHMAGDAMIAVSLAGTLFFTAAAGAQRSNVALFLLLTMAPFAIVAPLIGPALDRLQPGRRWALAGSLGGRAVLAVLMAVEHDALVLYPAALGVLVLSRAFTVLRAAAVPRELPPGLSLTAASTRLSVVGLAAGGLLGAVGAGLTTVLGFGWALSASAAVFCLAAVLALRLPQHLDAPVGEDEADVLPTAPLTVPRSRRRPTPHLVTALRATAALRGLSGFLTIFSAFLVQATVDGGWAATTALGGIAAAAGAGSFAGHAVGARVRRSNPDRVVLGAAGAAAGITALAAFTFSLPMAALVAGVAAVTNALGRSALQAVTQRDVPESLRASALARSQTWLQLAWILGGLLAIALPPTGRLGFTVAAGLLVPAIGLTLWSVRSRRGLRTTDREAWT